MYDTNRVLNIYADDLLVCDGLRKKLTGKSTMTLYPDIYQVDIYNPSSADLSALRSASIVSVTTGDARDSIISASLTDIVNRVDNGLRISTLFFMPGEPFWRAFISVGFLFGTPVSDALNAILSQAGVKTANIPDINSKLVRGYSFFGRAAESVEDISKTFGFRSWTSGDSFFSTYKGIGDTALTIDDSELIGTPETMQNTLIVNIPVRSVPVGRMAKTSSGTMRITSAQYHADTYSGDWYVSINLADENAMTLAEWEGMA